MALGSIQPLAETSIRNITWGVKKVGAYGWQPYHLLVPIVRKSGGFNLLQTYRSVIGLHRDCSTLLSTITIQSPKLRNNARCKLWILSKISTNQSETHKRYKIRYARGGWRRMSHSHIIGKISREFNKTVQRRLLEIPAEQ